MSAFERHIWDLMVLKFGRGKSSKVPTKTLHSHETGVPFFFSFFFFFNIPECRLSSSGYFTSLRCKGVERQPFGLVVLWRISPKKHIGSWQKKKKKSRLVLSPSLNHNTLLLMGQRKRSNYIVFLQLTSHLLRTNLPTKLHQIRGGSVLIKMYALESLDRWPLPLTMSEQSIPGFQRLDCVITRGMNIRILPWYVGHIG